MSRRSGVESASSRWANSRGGVRGRRRPKGARPDRPVPMRPPALIRGPNAKPRCRRRSRRRSKLRPTSAERHQAGAFSRRCIILQPQSARRPGSRPRSGATSATVAKRHQIEHRPSRSGPWVPASAPLPLPVHLDQASKTPQRRRRDAPDRRPRPARLGLTTASAVGQGFAARDGDRAREHRPGLRLRRARHWLSVPQSTQMIRPCARSQMRRWRVRSAHIPHRPDPARRALPFAPHLHACSRRSSAAEAATIDIIIGKDQQWAHPLSTAALASLPRRQAPYPAGGAGREEDPAACGLRKAGASGAVTPWRARIWHKAWGSPVSWTQGPELGRSCAADGPCHRRPVRERSTPRKASEGAAVSMGFQCTSRRPLSSLGRALRWLPAEACLIEGSSRVLWPQDGRVTVDHPAALDPVLERISNRFGGQT